MMRMAKKAMIAPAIMKIKFSGSEELLMYGALEVGGTVGGG